MGKVTIIDYPNNCFCVMSPAATPWAELGETAWSNAILRNGKLFVLAVVGGAQTDDLLFDSGTSAMPVLVDLALWKTLTGLEDAASSPDSFTARSWGQEKTWRGAPTRDAVRVGTADIGHPLVFTDPSRPETFIAWPFKAAGTIGNAPFWDRIVILDLTAQVRFGLEVAVAQTAAP